MLDDPGPVLPRFIRIEPEMAEQVDQFCTRHVAMLLEQGGKMFVEVAAGEIRGREKAGKGLYQLQIGLGDILFPDIVRLFCGIGHRLPSRRRRTGPSGAIEHNLCSRGFEGKVAIPLVSRGQLGRSGHAG